MKKWNSKIFFYKLSSYILISLHIGEQDLQKSCASLSTVTLAPSKPQEWMTPYLKMPKICKSEVKKLTHLLSLLLILTKIQVIYSAIVDNPDHSIVVQNKLESKFVR